MLKRAPHTAEFTSRISPSAKQEVDHSLLVLPLLVCAPRELTQCQVLAFPDHGTFGCPLYVVAPASLQYEPDPRLCVNGAGTEVSPTAQLSAALGFKPCLAWPAIHGWSPPSGGGRSLRHLSGCSLHRLPSSTLHWISTDRQPREARLDGPES